MLKQFLFLLLSLQALNVWAQNTPESKFPRAALKADLEFIRQQLFHAHANPFTELDSLSYTRLFDEARRQLTDSMTVFEFAKLAKPLFAPLSDEHANVGIKSPGASLTESAIFLPFSAERKGTYFVVKEVLDVDTGLQPGDTIQSIEGNPMAAVNARCAGYTTGFPEQRLDKSLAQLGVTYVFAYPNKPRYAIETARKKLVVTGVGLQAWKDYLAKSRAKTTCDGWLHYQSFGKVGYIDFCSFGIRSEEDFKQLEGKLAEIFNQIKQEKIETLVIDVSQNSGGNSRCGDMIINYFYKKPYLDYGCKWRRSDEYLNQMAQWKMQDEQYQKTPVGGVLSFGPSTTTPARKVKNRFKGKVYLVVGPNTFSSAIMFATIVKDNKMATLVGETPTNGHPNHFGEMYGANTPNTGLSLSFGVKEWIRPSGEKQQNQLIPDQLIRLDPAKGPEALIRQIRY